jgi:hypothetical protein
MCKKKKSFGTLALLGVLFQTTFLAGGGPYDAAECPDRRFPPTAARQTWLHWIECSDFVRFQATALAHPVDDQAIEGTLVSSSWCCFLALRPACLCFA